MHGTNMKTVINYLITYSLREKNIRAIIRENVRAVENRFNSGKRFEDKVTVYETVKGLNLTFFRPLVPKNIL